MRPYVVDLALSQRLERAEAKSNAEFVEARARLSPSSGACFLEVRGALAMFDGPTSPCTQTFGLGIFQMPTADDFEAIERFFQSKNAPVHHEVSPLVDQSILATLHARGYRPIELTSVMFRPIGDGAELPEASERVTVRPLARGEEEAWAATSARGWSEQKEFADLILDLARVTAHKSAGLASWAEIDGRAVATAAMSITDGVALLAGASTIPEARNQGAQSALLAARLRHARRAGCDLALMCALPGSASQRNAERQGFRIAYTRIKWMLGGE
jgi:GNAT superfamily N-acetyltransferase